MAGSRSTGDILAEATASDVPEAIRTSDERVGGRRLHTEHLGQLLAEMQWMQRSYPGLEW